MFTFNLAKKVFQLVLCFLGVAALLFSCVESELDCFETPPSFCDARRQFIGFEIEGVRYRFCQPEFAETFTERQAPFFVINNFTELLGTSTVRASFIIPNLFTFQLHLPADSTDYTASRILQVHPFTFTDQEAPLFSGALFFTQECEMEYSTLVPSSNITQSFHWVESFEKRRTFEQGDSTIVEYQMQGIFQGQLNGFPNENKSISIENGAYDLLLWEVELR